MKQIPIKATKSGANATGFSEFSSVDFLSIEDGGTGAITADGARDNLDIPGKSTTNFYTAANRGVIVPLIDAGTITPDLDAGNNFAVTLGGNRILANPSTPLVPGQSGCVAISQDAIGGRTLAFGSYYKFASGVVPSLTQDPLANDKLYYYVDTATEITVSFKGDVR